MDIDRIGLEGEIDAVKLIRVTQLAHELGLRVVDLSRATEENTNQIESSTENIHAKDDESASLIAPIKPLENMENNIPFRRVSSKASFQNFGFDKLVDPLAEERIQRSKKSWITNIWVKLASAQFSDCDRFAEEKKANGKTDRIIKPIQPENIIGVGLPKYKFVPKVNGKVILNTSLYDKVNITYVVPEECDDIDLDGLASYLVAVAEKVIELDGRHSLNNKNSSKLLKTLIPYGISMPSLKILSEYCADQLRGDDDAPISSESLDQVASVFGLFSKSK